MVASEGYGLRGQRAGSHWAIMVDVTVGQAIVIVILGVVLLYVAWTMWQPVWRDWTMVSRGITVLATVTDVVPVLAGDDRIHRASIVVPRMDGTWFHGHTPTWPGHSFAAGELVRVRYDPAGRLKPRLVDRWLWKAAAASLTVHITTLLLALGTAVVGLIMIIRTLMDVMR
jgi:hypothetical protein